MLQEISVADLKKRRERGERLEVVDVRTPAEFREIHIPFAKNVPLESFDPDEFTNQRWDRSVPLVIVCRTGNRAGRACRRLRKSGLENAYVLAGGIEQWEQAGLEVVRGKKTISLERQVRMTAGAMVFAGTLLGAWVHPWLLAIPAFVGAGLIYAGVTDSCPMALLIARMPWNQVGRDAAAAARSCCQEPPETKTRPEEEASRKEVVCG